MVSLPTPIVECQRFESSNWANGSVLEDKFYMVEKDVTSINPGTTLKVEDSNTAGYLLPPCTAMTRMVYVSETITGSRVPVSAFILWPFSPKQIDGGYPIAAWAHGTSGITADSAPSNHKNVWQHFLAPYQLSTQGYVVVATDYAGLGVHKTSSGEPITHQYMACPSHANDVVYAVQAAQQAFPKLSKNFVVIGHSQGGGAAWATAQRQAIQPVSGYLGAVAVSPVTSLLDLPEPLLSVLNTAICPGMASTFPDFQIADILTKKGEERLAVITASKANMWSSLALLLEADLLHPDWKENHHRREYHYMTSNGGKPIGGPLLVFHGETDDKLSASVTAAAIDETAMKFPECRLEYYFLPKVGHVPALQASQRVWMEWIADRFAGREIEPMCRRAVLEPARAVELYQAEQNWYVEAATQPFHAP